MPTFPAKTNYLSGDVLTAAQMVDVGNGLNDLLPDAKGSLTTVSAANTPAQLTVGNNGETLVADSSTSTGLRWQGSQAAGRNAIINGAFDIWQRGTSIAYTAGNTFFADRWSGYRGGLVTGATISRQLVSDTTNLPTIQYCLRFQRDSGNTSTQNMNIWYNAETSDSIRFAAQQIVFSFWARKGANYSANNGDFTAYIQTGTGTDQSLASGYTGQSTLITKTIQPTTTWTRYTATATVSSSATQIGVQFAWVPVGTAGAADYVEIAGVQVELGSVATPFSRAGGTLAGELQAAMRYYQKSYSQATAPATATSVGSINGINTSTTLVAGLGRFPVVMRTAPTVTLYSSADGATGQIRSGGANVAGTPSDVSDGAIGYIAATGLTANSNSTIQYALNSEL